VEIAEAFIFALGVTSLALALFRLAVYRRKGLARLKRGERASIADSLGLQLSSNDERMTGVLSGCAVEVEWGLSVAEQFDAPYTSLSVDLGVPLDVRRASTVRDLISRRRTLTGDHTFDSVCAIEGDLLFARAALSCAARDLLRSLLVHDVKCRAGKLIDVVHYGVDESSIRSRLHRLLEAAPLLRLDRGELVLRLAQNAQRDPSLGVRLRCLRLLMRTFPEQRETLAAEADALRDQMPLKAAVHLARGDRAELAAMEDALIRELGEEDDEVVLVAIEALGEAGSINAVEALARCRLSSAARAAVDAIQSRSSGASAGHLAVVESSSGGSVSLAEEPRGRLSSGED
jgi:hypothetical protein